MQGVNQVVTDAAAVSLVGHGGVLETIAQDQAAGVDRRSDDLLDVLRPGRRVKEQLAGRGHGGVARVQDESADLVADRGSARLARQEMVDPQILDMIGEQLDLCRLPRSFDPLEGDESSDVRFGAHRLRDPSGP